jgi:hypothetical protein
VLVQTRPPDSRESLANVRPIELAIGNCDTHAAVCGHERAALSEASAPHGFVMLAVMRFPSRVEVEEHLAALAEGRLSPEEVSDWARPFVVDDSTHPTPMDWAVWQGLEALIGADLRVTPNDYLHGVADFEKWLADFRRSIDD